MFEFGFSRKKKLSFIADAKLQVEKIKKKWGQTSISD